MICFSIEKARLFNRHMPATHLYTHTPNYTHTHITHIHTPHITHTLTSTHTHIHTHITHHTHTHTHTHRYKDTQLNTMLVTKYCGDFDAVVTHLKRIQEDRDNGIDVVFGSSEINMDVQMGLYDVDDN